MKKVLVAGATGNVGREVVKNLLKFDVRVKAAVTKLEDISRLNLDSYENIEPVVFDFTNGSTFEKAFINVDKFFLLRPPAISNPKTLYPVIDFAKEKRISQIAFLSLMGVESNRITPHYKIEKYIIQSGVPYTFVRPSFYMQNLSTTHLKDILEHDEVFVPAGKGATSFIDVRDIGEATAVVLTGSGHSNKAYTLTGGKALTYSEVADTLTEVLGRKIAYTDPSILQFWKRMRKYGHDSSFVFVMEGIYLVVKLGKASEITNDLKHLIEKDPISFKQFAKDYKDVFLRKILN